MVLEPSSEHLGPLSPVISEPQALAHLQFSSYWFQWYPKVIPENRCWTTYKHVSSSEVCKSVLCECCPTGGCALNSNVSVWPLVVTVTGTVTFPNKGQCNRKGSRTQRQRTCDYALTLLCHMNQGIYCRTPLATDILSNWAHTAAVDDMNDRSCTMTNSWMEADKRVIYGKEFTLRTSLCIFNLSLLFPTIF